MRNLTSPISIDKFSSLPASHAGAAFSVLVAGAGPAGAVAAKRLADAGFRVGLIDKATFPRDKTCGDGLIHDSIAALKQLGAYDAVVDRSHGSPVLEVLSPRGIPVPIHGEFRVLRRRELDNLLYKEAIAAGAVAIRATVKGPIEDNTGRVVGLRVSAEGNGANGDEDVELRAPLTILATGADAGILKKFDPDARSSASGTAVRTYARRATGALDRLFISLEKDLLPGYAWAFPGPDDLMNVGVGVFYSSGPEKKINLRERLDRLMAGEGMLGKRLGPLTPLERYSGAPLRTGMTGSSLGRTGLAIIGDAAGTTYGLTGEGIGKGMESGMLVASLAAGNRDDLATVGLTYRDEMRTQYVQRFRTYEIAERWMRVPAFADLVAWRANRSPWVLKHLTRVLTEDTMPDRVFSARALWALLTR